MMKPILNYTYIPIIVITPNSYIIKLITIFNNSIKAKIYRIKNIII